MDVPATYRRIVASVRKAANAPHFQPGEYVSTANVEYRSAKWGRTLYLSIDADQRCILVEQLWRSNQPDQLRGVKGRCAYEGWLLQLDAEEGDTSFLYENRYLVINGPDPDSTQHDIQLVTPDLCLYTMHSNYDVGAAERLFEEYRRGKE